MIRDGLSVEMGFAHNKVVRLLDRSGRDGALEECTGIRGRRGLQER